MGASDDRQDVMLTVRFHTDIAQHDHFVVAVGLLEGAAEIVKRVFAVTGAKFLVGAHHARRRVDQSFSVGILADEAQDRPHRALGLLASGLIGRVGVFRLGAAHGHRVRGVHREVSSQQSWNLSERRAATAALS